MSNVVPLPGASVPAAAPERASLYAVANRIIAFGLFQAGPGTPPMTPRRIQALAYLAYGHHLVVHLHPLCRYAPEAWREGPGFGDLAYALHTYGDEPVAREIAGPRGVEALPAGPARRLVDRVCLAYAHHDAGDLAVLVKGRARAWAQTLAARPEGSPIPAEHLRADFLTLALPDWSDPDRDA